MANFINDGLLVLGECASQNIGPARRKPRKRLADLQNMFLIDDEAISAFEAVLQ
jgi:hypothetical protein